MAAYRPGIDPTLARITERAFFLRPEDRFQSADEMSAALGQWLDTRSRFPRGSLAPQGRLAPSTLESLTERDAGRTLTAPPTGPSVQRAVSTAPLAAPLAVPSQPPQMPGAWPPPPTSDPRMVQPAPALAASNAHPIHAARPRSVAVLAVGLSSLAAVVVAAIVLGAVFVVKDSKAPEPSDASAVPTTLASTSDTSEPSDLRRSSPEYFQDGGPRTSTDAGFRPAPKPTSDSPIVGTPCKDGTGFGVTCVNGKWTCMTGYVSCGGTCTNLGGNPYHCGACGKLCPAPNHCVNADCVPCTSPRQTCSNRCVDVRFDTANCGGCGKLCPGGETCWKAACTKGPFK